VAGREETALAAPLHDALDQYIGDDAGTQNLFGEREKALLQLSEIDVRGIRPAANRLQVEIFNEGVAQTLHAVFHVGKVFAVRELELIS
jgi:hypothetical protein